MLRDEPTGPGTIQLHLHVGGSLGDPAWTGPGKPVRHRGVVTFHVGIPREIQDVSLEDRFLEFADASIETATKTYHQAGLDFDEAGHRRAVATTRERLAALPPAAVRREAFRDFEERFARRKSMQDARPEPYPEPRPGPSMPSLQFSWSSQADLERLFELEEEVDRRLQASALGEVDGNEIGGDTYDLFLSPRPRQKRHVVDMAEKVVAEAGLEHLRTTPRRESNK